MTSDDELISSVLTVGAKRKTSVMNSPFASSATTTPSKTLLWGATGEQEWTPALTTGEYLR